MKQLSLTVLTLTALCAAASAGRPLAIDDAGVVETGFVQLEVGFGYTDDKDFRHHDFPVALSFGVAPTLQLGVGFGAQSLRERDDTGWNRESGTSDLELSAKWNPLAADRFWVDHSLTLTIKLPTADDKRGLGSGKTDVDLTYIATKQLTETFAVDVNCGHTWVGGETDTLRCGVAMRWQASDRLELVAEVVTDTVLARRHDTAVAVSGGLRWSMTEVLVLDAAVGCGGNRHAPDWTATAGLTWTFGPGK